MALRYKESGSVAVPAADVAEVATNESGSYTWYHPGLYSAGSHEQMFGFDTPNYHRRKASGELLPQTTFRQSIETRSGGAFGWDAVTDPATGYAPTSLVATGSGFLPPPSSWPEPVHADTDRLMQEALVRLYASGFDGLTFIAELGSVRRMFQGAWKRLSAFTKKYSASKAGGVYLEARYGWRPLINDIVAINKLISEISDTRPAIFKGTSGINHSASSSAQTLFMHYHGLFPDVELDWSLTVDVNTRVSVYSRIQPPLVRFDAVTTAHELIPLSFVLDWFLAVGNWLQGHIAARHHSDAIGAIGRQTTSVATIVGATYVRSGYIGSAYASSVFTSVVQERTPTVVDVPNLPGPTFNLDFFKVGDLLLIFKQLANKASIRNLRG